MKDWLIIAATLLSPLIAVQVSGFLQRRREKEERKFRVFQALMASRAATLSPQFVEALNMVDVAFYGRDRQSKEVVESCKLYIEHHDYVPPRNDSGWGPRRSDLLLEMLQKMSTALGYDFDKVTIKRTSYLPVAYGTQEQEVQEIRKLSLALLRGERGLPVYVPSATTASKTASLPDAGKAEPPRQ